MQSVLEEDEKVRILHYLLGMPPVRGGGLIRYALDMAAVQKEMGEEVFLLTPGGIYGRNNSNVAIRRKKAYKKVPVFQIRNPLPISMANGIKDIEWFTGQAGYQAYFHFLQSLKPDVIHVHSLMGIHQSFFKAAHDLGIRSIFTTHDYFGLCPVTTLIKKGNFCEEKDWKSCAECCEYAFGTLHLMLDQSKLYRGFMNLRTAEKILLKLATLKAAYIKHREGCVKEKMPATAEGTDKGVQTDYLALQNYYWKIWKDIDCFHFNSEIAKDTFEKRIGQVTSVVIPILNKNCGDYRKIRKYGRVLRVGYLGNQSANKGYPVLEEAAEKLWHQNSDIRLNIYFPTNENKEFIRSHEHYDPAELPKVFDENDMIVVPSLVKETFGLVVAEALSYAVPVVVSENVGAKLLLQENPGMGEILDGNISESLYECLKRLLQDRDILKQWNKNICEADIDYSFEKHVRTVMDKCYG